MVSSYLSAALPEHPSQWCSVLSGYCQHDALGGCAARPPAEVGKNWVSTAVDWGHLMPWVGGEREGWARRGGRLIRPGWVQWHPSPLHGPNPHSWVHTDVSPFPQEGLWAPKLPCVMQRMAWWHHGMTAQGVRQDWAVHEVGHLECWWRSPTCFCSIP